MLNPCADTLGLIHFHGDDACVARASLDLPICKRVHTGSRSPQPFLRRMRGTPSKQRYLLSHRNLQGKKLARQGDQ